MDEEKKEEMEEKGTEEKKPAEDPGEGVQPETTRLIDDANLAAKRLEEANKVKAELLKREEELEARRALGGRSEAGQNQDKPQFTDEEKASRARIKAVGDASGSSWAKKYE